MTTIGSMLEEFREHPTGPHVHPVLTLTEKRGFVRQSERFRKRLATEDTSTYKVIRRNDVAFNPYLLWAGAVAQNQSYSSGVISPLYPTFRVRDGFDPRYVGRFLLLPAMVAMYDAIAFGSVPRRRRTSVSDFLKLQIPAQPPAEEQRRIAEILDQTDALRVKQRQVLKHLDALKQSIFHDMFGDLVPEVTVEDIALKIRTGPFGSQLLHSEFVDAGVAVLGLDNVVSNEFAWTGARFITDEKYADLKRYTVGPGDVLISIMGTTGRCVVVPDGIPRSINTKHLCAVTPDHERAVPEYLQAAFLWDVNARRHLQKQTKGSIMSGLNMGIIKSMPLPLPPITTQQAFRDRIAAASSAKADATRRLKQIDELFASLQSRAFRGEL